MTRSKMIEEIEYLICTCHPDEFPSSEAILARIENLGMLPPFSHKVFERNWARMREGARGNEWDEEE